MLPIEVTSLKKHYGDLEAVDGISFTVNEGEVFGLLVPTAQEKPPLQKSWKAYANEMVET